MYRNTEKHDLQNICDIYNDITGRKRTASLHNWEWFTSPYSNKSYVIIDKNENVLGHHGILTIKLQMEKQVFTAGKTENTIMQKGYGPLYFKNEMAMHKEYSKEYDILITTTAKGVTKKIREKLGYKVFGSYVSFFRLVDSSFISSRVSSSLLKGVIKLFSPMVNIFLFKDTLDKNYTISVDSLSSSSLKVIEEFSQQNIMGVSQLREIEFLKYRLLDNPYKNFFLFTLKKESKVNAYVIYSIEDERLAIEDIVYKNEKDFDEVLKQLFNYVKTEKIAKVITFITLENSILDIRKKGFIRKPSSKDSNKFMLKLSENIDKDRFKIDDFYFTKLMTEGIS